MDKVILYNVAALNKLSLQSLTDEDNNSIIKNFAQESQKVLKADFAFAWGRFNGGGYKLIYKSSNTSCKPQTPPKNTAGHNASKKGYLLFDEDVKKKNYEGNIGDFIKSYIMIPVRYGDHVFGSIVLCYKNHHKFTEEELILSETIGNTVGRAVTINWFIDKAQKALALAEKQKETEILLAQEKLKTEFIQNATHELRTPLAIMKGNVDLALIQEIKSEESIKDVLNTVNTEIKHLSHIIEDLAIFTTEGKPNEEIIRSASVNLATLIQNIVSRLKTLTPDKNIYMEMLVEAGHNFTIHGDAKYLEKLFLNIIKNAINYGKKGGKIIVELKKVKNNAQVKITDDGIGIKAEELSKIFERFYRTEDARELKKKGIGLGLAISQWVTKIHGGTIDVKSTYGKGTTFIIELPLAN